MSAMEWSASASSDPLRVTHHTPTLATKMAMLTATAVFTACISRCCLALAPAVSGAGGCSASSSSGGGGGGGRVDTPRGRKSGEAGAAVLVNKENRCVRSEGCTKVPGPAGPQARCGAVGRPGRATLAPPPPPLGARGSTDRPAAKERCCIMVVLKRGQLSAAALSDGS
jgi:hypothetical protein